MEDSLDLACVLRYAGDAAFRIHCLKRSAYSAVLRAFCAKSDLLSRAKEERLAELRNELKVSDAEHGEYLVKASPNKHIKSLSAGLYKGNIGGTEVMKDSLNLACVIPDAGDTAFQFHCLERSAYASVLRAFCAQSNLLSWLQAKLLTKLRNELRISNIEHKEVLVRVSSNDYIKSLRKFSLANDSGLTEINPAFDARVVVPGKIVKAGQVSASSSNCLSLAQQSTIPAHSMSSARNIGTLGTSHSAKKVPRFYPQVVVPAKKLKSGNGSALAYLKRPPYAEQLPVAVSSVLVKKSSVDDPLDSKTSPCEVKAGCALSPIFQEKHSQSNADHVPLCVHQNMQESRKREIEVSPMKGSKSLSVIISSAGNEDHGYDIIKLRLTSSLLNKVEELFGEKPDPANLETAKSMLKDQEKQLLDALVKLCEVSYAAAHFGTNCQPAEFNQHDEGDGDEETPPKPVISSYETPPQSVLGGGEGTETGDSGGSFRTLGGGGGAAGLDVMEQDQPALTCTSSTESRRAGHEVKIKGAQGREFEPAAKRSRRPSVKLSGSWLW